MNRHLHALLLLAAIGLLAWMFANLEVQIEGSAGWAANLPTWRIEHHWLLDLLFGGRAMTGYHAWALPCILGFFHLPLCFLGRWSWRLEARAMAGFILFWIAEDALWFICNPAFGWSRLTPEHATWHKHWLFGLPLDYLLFGVIGCVLHLWSFGNPRRHGNPGPSPAGSPSSSSTPVA